MKERVDTFQVGPSSIGGIKTLIEDKIPDVLVEARITAEQRTITVRAKYTIEDSNNAPPGLRHIAHIYIEYENATLSPFNLVKERTVGTETWKAGVYAP